MPGRSVGVDICWRCISHVDIVCNWAFRATHQEYCREGTCVFIQNRLVTSIRAIRVLNGFVSPVARMSSLHNFLRIAGRTSDGTRHRCRRYNDSKKPSSTYPKQRRVLVRRALAPSGRQVPAVEGEYIRRLGAGRAHARFKDLQRAITYGPNGNPSMFA